MAARNYATPRVLTREAVGIMGSFAPNGSSAISSTTSQGLGWTVAYTSTGLYSVTFSDKFAAFLAATATIQMATAADVVAQIGTWTASTKVLQIRSLAAAVVTDIAADANNRIHFVAWFRNSAALPVHS